MQTTPEEDRDRATGTHMAGINICRRSAVINNNLHSQFAVQRPVRDFILIKLCAALSACAGGACVHCSCGARAQRLRRRGYYKIKPGSGWLPHVWPSACNMQHA